MSARLLVLANGLLLLAIALVIGLVQLGDRSGAQIDGAVGRYAAAVGAQDLRAALAELAPDDRARWADFVQAQLGNTYEVRAVSVRSPSLLDRLVRRAPSTPYEATLVLDVDRDDPDSYYQATTRVPLRQDAGRWYLAAPPLAQ
jgi:hypothetical protein